MTADALGLLVAGLLVTLAGILLWLGLGAGRRR